MTTTPNILQIDHDAAAGFQDYWRGLVSARAVPHLAAAFARHRQNTIPDTSPGSILNEYIAELGDSEPFVVSRDGDGWAIRTMSGWRVLQPPLHPELVERAAIVAWLRYNAIASGLTRELRKILAGEIERGDHLTQPTEDKSDATG